jgi:MYXO-CTERM domain-containing protein
MPPAGLSKLSMRGRIVAAVIALPIITSTAHAYVQNRNDSQKPEYWQASCVSVTVYTNGFSMLTRDEIAKSIGAAAQAWSPSAVDCAEGGHPSIEIVPSMAGDNTRAPAFGYDAHNTVFFVSEGWPVDLVSAVAITSVFTRSDGRIVDVDMRINAEWSDWANLDPGFDPAGFNGQFPFDLQNAVTHEFGHLLGFGHTCWSPFSDRERPIDDQGQGVPDCSDSVPEEIQQTVMYAIVDPLRLEVSKRFLTSDEVRGVCEIYPPTAAAPTCALDTPNDGCGCAAGAGDGNGDGDVTGVLALLAVAVITIRMRRAPRAARG